MRALSVVACALFVLAGFGVRARAQSAAPAPPPPRTAPQPTVQTAPTTAADDADSFAADQYLVGPKDKLSIVVIPDPVPGQHLTQQYTVGADGRITVPTLSEPVKVSDLTVGQIATKIRDTLVAAQLLTNPQVTVEVAEYRSQSFSVRGEVANPGTYSLKGTDMTLNGALNAAGNRKPTAGETITVLHDVKPNPGLALDPSDPNVEKKEYNWTDLVQGRDPRIYDGDNIIVPTAEFIYIEGQVRSYGKQVWKQGMTVGVALDQAGGMTDRASLDRSYIRRWDPVAKKYIKVDINGQLEMPLKPDDSVHIESKFF